MLAQHAGKCTQAVRNAIKAAGLKPEKFPGVHGLRIPEKEANKFLLKHWPDVGPLPQLETR